MAAGLGERLGHGVPKALVRLGDAPMLVHALRGLAAAGFPDPVVVHTPGHDDEFRAVTNPAGITRLVVGGATRHESVRAGLAVVHPRAATVAIHDAARPLTPPDMIVDAVEALDDEGTVASAPALDVADTLKRVTDGTVATVDRTDLVAVQTPQVFRLSVLRQLLADAPESPNAVPTDELMLVEEAIRTGRADGQIALVSGSLLGTKVTTPEDLALLGALVEGRS